jgi:hypothetical protein
MMSIARVPAVSPLPNPAKISATPPASAQAATMITRATTPAARSISPSRR